MKTLLALLFSSALMLAADVSGEWDWQMPGPGGEPVKARLMLKADGTKLTGTFVFSESRKLELQDGKIDGNKVQFTIKRERPQGGGMSYEMQGTVDGDQMKGTAATDMGGQKADAEWTAARRK